MDLEDVLETYENIYNNETYKKGLYPILSQQPEEMGYVPTREMEIILCLIQWKKMP